MAKKKRKYITPKALAKALGVTKMTVYRWVWEGRIKAYTTPGGRIRIPISELKKTRKRKTKK